MLVALAVGQSDIRGLLEGEDVLATAEALRGLGAQIEPVAEGHWRVHGVGVGGLLQPRAALDLGNSGTSARLLMGLIATHPLQAVLTGDASLSRRPMARVMEPLARMGAEFLASPGERLPLTVRGAVRCVPIRYELPVASAQVKSAILLAALNTLGTTEVVERWPTRDHSERMLAAAGAQIAVETDGPTRNIRITGEADLRPMSIDVPGDPSSAAFFLIAASIVPGSAVTLCNVGMNPTRSGMVTVLRAMGADIVELDPREVGGEPVADLLVRHAPLSGVVVDPALAPTMIDEFPALFVAAAFASGRTTTRGLEELRVKESDRLATMARALRTIGAAVEEQADGLTITGSGGDPLPGSDEPIVTHFDHRIAMSMAIAGLHSRAGTAIDDMTPVATSFPDFVTVLEGLRA